MTETIETANANKGAIANLYRAIVPLLCLPEFPPVCVSVTNDYLSIQVPSSEGTEQERRDAVDLLAVTLGLNPARQIGVRSITYHADSDDSRTGVFTVLRLGNALAGVST